MSKSPGSRYIWDEYDLDGDDGGSALSTLTSARHDDDFEAFEAKYTQPARKALASNAVNMNSITAAAEEISKKVQAMKKELSNLQKKELDLRQQREQIRSVKERRIIKARAAHDDRMSHLEADSQAKLQEARELLEGVTKEVKDIGGKYAALCKKHEQNKVDYEAKLAKLKQMHRENFLRDKKQWESYEETAFKNALKEKQEVMKKQAIEALTPKLDAQVTSNKMAVIQRREVAENALQKAKHTLQAKFDRKVTDYRNKLSQEIDSEIQKARKTSKLELEALQRKHDQERSNLKSRFQTEKSLLEESHDKTTRTDIDAHQEALLLINRKENGIIQELLETQQRELKYLAEHHSEELNRVKRRLMDTEKEHLEKLRTRQSQVEQQRREQQEQELQRRMNIETNEMRNKIKQDAEDTQRQLHEDFEKQVQGLRLKVADRMDHLKQNEQKLRQSIATCTSEISQLTDSNGSLRQKVSNISSTLTEDLKPQVESLRRELHAVEAELEGLEDRHYTAVQEKETQLERERQEVQARVEELQERLSSQQYELSESRNKQDFEFRVELNSIKEKVTRLMNKKNASLVELQGTLQDLIISNDNLQNELEEIRRKRQ